MRLKFSLNEYQKIAELLSMLKCLEKHSDRIVLITRVDSITLTVPRDGINNKTYLWFDINCHWFCDVYKMEGVKPDDPDTDLIMFEVDAKNILAALKTIDKTVDFVEIKLGKTDFPFFSVNIKMQPGAAGKVEVSHIVPVLIIPRIGWGDNEIPYESVTFDVQARLPRLPVVKKLIDTFKSTATMRFILRDDNSLTLEAEGDTSRHFMIVSPIKVTKYQKPEKLYRGGPKAVAVEVKRISHFLNSLSFLTKINLCVMIKDKRDMKLCFRFRDDVLGHFIVPAIFEETPDEDESMDSN